MHTPSRHAISNLLPALACAVAVTLAAGSALAAGPSLPWAQSGSDSPTVTPAGCIVHERIGRPVNNRTLTFNSCKMSATEAERIYGYNDWTNVTSQPSNVASSTSQTSHRTGPSKAIQAE